jgi:hypothetical protein
MIYGVFLEGDTDFFSSKFLEFTESIWTLKVLKKGKQISAVVSSGYECMNSVTFYNIF